MKAIETFLLPPVRAVLTAGGLVGLLVLPAAGGAQSPPAAEEPSSEVEDYQYRERLQVVGERPQAPAIDSMSRVELPEFVAGDAADLLRSFSGVALGRMGGHGLEPRIRGLGEGNLNVLIDGAYVHGGCPNRMDPPASFAATESIDRVTVIRGVQSLRYGAGGNAGTVLFERLRPPVDEETPWSARVDTGYGSFHERPEVGLDAAWSRGAFWLRAVGESRSFDNYEDGDGEEVRSAYDSRGLDLLLGYGDDDGGSVKLTLGATRTDDALFAGAGMDSPKDSSESVRLELRRGRALGAFEGLEADLYFTGVEHLMDNYSLRELSAPMALRVPSTSDTFGGRVSGELTPGEVRLTLGVDYLENRREALRYAGPTPERVTMLQSVLWPDARLSQAGLFAEGERPFGERSRLRFGARVDRFDARAPKAGVDPMGANRSPEALYATYYGETAADWDDTDWSALLRWERDLGRTLTLFTGISRSVRPADATERYLGSDSAMGPMRWIGNPQIESSRHRQLDLGLAGRNGGFDWSVTGFADDVEDFILRDRARGQAGILVADLATVYRNVDARLYGAELEGSTLVLERLSLRATASWVRGEDRADDRPLAQIPPLQGRLEGRWGAERWSAGATLRWATRQDRVDDDPRTGSGLDYGETPGYAVLDLSAGMPLVAGLELRAGVDNLLDDTYADHLNRGNVFDPDPVRVNEPGRTLWLRLGWRAGAR